MMSRDLRNRTPITMVLHHRVEDHKQLAHAGGEGHFLGLACGTQALVEVPDHRVVAGGHQRPHVEGGSDLAPSSPHRAFSSQGSAVTVEGSDTHQGGDLAAIQPAPSSGRLASSVMDRTGPTPEALLSVFSLVLHIGLERM